MRRRILFTTLLAAVAVTWGCTRDDSERRALLEEAQRTNIEIARGAIVRDLRTPSDSGRLVYDSPVSLRERPAQAAGAGEVWAPFGIAQPDTAR